MTPALASPNQIPTYSGLESIKRATSSPGLNPADIKAFATLLV